MTPLQLQVRKAPAELSEDNFTVGSLSNGQINLAVSVAAFTGLALIQSRRVSICGHGVHGEIASIPLIFKRLFAACWQIHACGADLLPDLCVLHIY